MAISPIESLSNSITGQSISGNDVIDKNEFLLLLVTQLQNQDPLNPMDYAEFTSQTAQFASLEQLQVINENLGYLQDYQSALFDENAVSFIGKTIKFPDNTVDLTGGAPEELHFEIDRDATEIYASIYDSDGNWVKEIKQTGSFDAGEHSLTWDGTDENGSLLPDGSYSFEIQAEDANRSKVTVAPFYTDTVTAVNFWNGTAYLSTGNRDVAIGNVQKITGN